MVPYQTPMSNPFNSPGPDPLQAALTSANQMAGQLAPRQPLDGPFGPARPPYSQEYHDDWNRRHMHQSMRNVERMMRDMNPYTQPSGLGGNPYPNPPVADPPPGPGPRFPDIQEQAPRINERIMNDMRQNMEERYKRRNNIRNPRPNDIPRPPRANPTGASHSPHQPYQPY